MLLTKLNDYQPDFFLDELRKRLEVSCDSDLAKVLGISASTISKIRRKSIPISANNLLLIHDKSEIPVKELRSLFGDTRKYFY